jgi:subtilisin-like proprotein convertase family protein
MHKRVLMILFSLFIGLGLVFMSLTMAGSPVAAGFTLKAQAASLSTDIDGDDETASETAKAAAAEEAVPDPGHIQAVLNGSSGPLFVGVDDAAVGAYTIDVTDNSFYPAFDGVEVWGAAYDPVGKRVFFNSGTQLWQWPVGGVPTLLGTITIGGNPASVVGLAFYNNTLYASRNIGDEDIYAINTTTLAATVALDLNPPDAELDLGGIDMDPVTGQLYGTNDAPALQGLVQIDPDGSVTVIAPYPNGETDIDGLAVGGGNAYLVIDQPGLIYVYNFETMTYTTPLDNPWTMSEVFAAGAWIEQPQRPTYCVQPGLDIPDNNPTGVSSDLLIYDNGSILDLDVRLDVSHTWVGDLIFTLEHLDTGTAVTFIDRPGVPTTTFGCSGDHINAYINDEGLGAVETTCLAGTPTIAGNLVGGDPPDDSLLAAFDGEDLAGTWRLSASDNAGGDTGTINEWCITPTIAVPEIAAVPDSLSSIQEANVQITQTLTISNVGGGILQWGIGELPGMAINTYNLPGSPAAPRSFEVAEPVVTGPDQCGLYENYPGAEPAGYAEHCLGIDPQMLANSASYFGPFGASGLGFAHDIGFVSDNVVEFSLNDFPVQTVRSKNNQSIYAYDYNSSGTILYALYNAGQEFGTFDPSTGTFTAIGSAIPNPGHTWSGLAIHPVEDTIYASSTTAASSTLYTIDAATGEATPVGDITGVSGVIAIAMNAEGELYAHDIIDDAIYQVDPATGEATLIGLTGYNASFAQGMDFDNSDGTLYIFLYTGGGANVFGTVDLTTGAVTPLAEDNPLGEFEGAVRSLVPCDGDVPWVFTEPITGTTPGGSAADVIVTFDSTGLSHGVYTGSLCIDSSDLSSPRITIPVTLTVNTAPAAADDIYSTVMEETLTVPAPGVLENDSDADGDPLEAVLDTPPANGSLILNPDGSFTYTPDAGFEGQDSFTYYANDGFEDSNLALVTINVESGRVYLPVIIKIDE